MGEGLFLKTGGPYGREALPFPGLRGFSGFPTRPRPASRPCAQSTAFSTGLPQTMFRFPLRSRSSSMKGLTETPSRSVIL